MPQLPPPAGAPYCRMCRGAIVGPDRTAGPTDPAPGLCTACLRRVCDAIVAHAGAQARAHHGPLPLGGTAHRRLAVHVRRSLLAAGVTRVLADRVVLKFLAGVGALLLDCCPPDLG